jgi:hypothetical protein
LSVIIITYIFVYGRCIFRSAILEKDLSKVNLVLDTLRPYDMQQRLSHEHENLPEFYSQIWTDSIQLLKDMKPAGFESVVMQLQEELLIFSNKDE